MNMETKVTVTAVELTRGGTPGWSTAGVFGAVQSFVSTHAALFTAGLLVAAGVGVWFIARRIGPVGLAGVLLLVGLALRGEVRRITGALSRKKRNGLSLAAAVLIED